MKLLNYLFIVFGLYVFLKSIFDVRMYGAFNRLRNTFAHDLNRK